MFKVSGGGVDEIELEVIPVPSLSDNMLSQQPIGKSTNQKRRQQGDTEYVVE
jgi:hypothetical protein